MWAACLPPAPIKASYQAGAQPILDLRPLELAVPYQWGLDPAFALWFDVHADVNEVASAAIDTLDYRFNSLPTIVQYNMYCDGSYTPEVHATTKKHGADQKAGWAFVVAAQTTPRPEDEVIVGIAAGPLLPQDMDHHGLETQSAETAEAFALHQAITWALIQTGESWHPVTMYYDLVRRGRPSRRQVHCFIGSQKDRQSHTSTGALCRIAWSSHPFHLRPQSPGTCPQ